MKRATLLLLLVVFAAVLVPALVYAQEAAPQATTTAATATAGALVTLPEDAAPVSAQEAYDSTEWMKPGDAPNLIVALLSLGAIAGLIAWGIVAQNRVARA